MEDMGVYYTRGHITSKVLASERDVFVKGCQKSLNESSSSLLSPPSMVLCTVDEEERPDSHLTSHHIKGFRPTLKIHAFKIRSFALKSD